MRSRSDRRAAIFEFAPNDTVVIFGPFLGRRLRSAVFDNFRRSVGGFGAPGQARNSPQFAELSSPRQEADRRSHAAIRRSRKRRPASFLASPRALRECSRATSGLRQRSSNSPI